MEEKKKLRQELINQREALSKQEWQEKSLALCEHLQQFLAHATVVSPQRIILSYFYFRQEPNLDPLFELKQYNWGVPRCVGETLNWHCYQPSDPLEKGKFGIREPKPEAPLCPVEKVDLILVPAVGCDHRGYRLGYGGGFYDRLFEQSPWRDIPKVGIIFDFAFVPKVPVEAWDIPLDGVCTDCGWRISL
ncbi:5-formyltetrahydrofolate cyclo-ligase [Euhalothece natronophila Z-M001]|uniref:5-formyltetrahydrofolate cyclo-ligase n=1 Tax=Euhalothece natronophila Z-M001 TaxID=522448 RepID=A0A5B8NMH8_9CHRO|nr:5-formyltetrahydrofolate cyclo-ligase [Euhalothece natronophila]QDZ40513.1 5-formyltetrahydrofolate cyclo-ligase [Euhalothece natronophila Z-M001]